MLVALNVATPFAAIWGPAPLNVPPPALVPKPSMIPGLAAVTRLLNWSRTSTWIAGVMAAPATTLLGPTRKERLVAAAGLTVTVSRWVIGTPATMADTTFASANVELKLPVATPFGSVVSRGWTMAFAVPVAASVTVLPRTGLPYWSRAVTVTVLALVPFEAVSAAGDATTLVCDAFTAPGTANAVKVRGDPTPVAWASCTLSVDVLRVPRVHVVEAMPLALDGDVAGFAEPAPLMTAQLIVTPATGLLNWSATRTESGVVSGWPTVPVWRSPPFTDIWVAPATLAVIVNVTVGRPVTPAVVVWVPGVGPRVRVLVAWPFTSVSEDGHATSTRTLGATRSEEHTSELRSPDHLVCRLLVEK